MQQSDSMIFPSQEGKVEQWLLNKSIQSSQTEFVTCLEIAIRNRYVRKIDLLFQCYSTSGDNDYKSVLRIASQRGITEVIDALLKRGASVDSQDEHGTSSLMVASKCGHYKVVKILLEHKANVNLKNNNGWSALMFASWNNRIKIIEVLLKKGANISKQFITNILSSTTHSEVLYILEKKLGKLTVL